MKKILLACGLFISCHQAIADTLTFDDLLPVLNVDNIMPDGYQGLNWNGSNQTGYIDVNPYINPDIVYDYGFKDTIIFNGYGYLAPNTTEISVANGGTFDFLSGYWSAGITGDVSILFQGFTDGLLVSESSIFNLQRDVITPITLNWFGIESLKIQSTAAIWTADNLEVNINPSAVPVPAAIWLLGSALLGFAGLRRKSV
jgi:hypothetical protein